MGNSSSLPALWPCNKSVALENPSLVVPPPSFQAKCHPREPVVSARVDKYFLDRWDFPSEKSRMKFVKAKFPMVVCFFFPCAKDDRIELACKLLTILFLVDDALEHMSLEEGRVYNDILKPLCLGSAQPDAKVPVQTIMHDLWMDIRACDPEGAEMLIQPTFVFLDAQTNRVRLAISNLGSYLQYREIDVGQPLIAALLCYVTDINMPPPSIEPVAELDKICSRHLSLVNDVFSYQKEIVAVKEGHIEGAAMCNAVPILVKEASLGSASSASRLLFLMCREWELSFKALRDEVLQDWRSAQDKAQIGGSSNNREVLEQALKFVEGLEYVMSGNEAWSRITGRYHD